MTVRLSISLACASVVRYASGAVYERRFRPPTVQMESVLSVQKSASRPRLPTSKIALALQKVKEREIR